MDKEYQADALQMHPEDPMSRAIMYLVYEAMKRGAKEVGDEIIYLVPSVLVGHSEKSLQETGEWEITLRKVS